MIIYVITHKNFKSITQLPIYKALQVGADSNPLLGYIPDNTGENISSFNPYFCELTGLYWIWKNDKSDIVGICHYRRYFVINSKILDEATIGEILNSYDVIVPKRTKYYFNLYKQYGYGHNTDDLDIVTEIIKEKYPDYYEQYNRVMHNDKCFSFNMMIMRKELFDNYCKWLFDILFVLEKKSNYKWYDAYNKRIFGFVSERLFIVWILKNNLNYKEIEVFNTEILQLKLMGKIKKRLKLLMYKYLKIDLRKKISSSKS